MCQNSAQGSPHPHAFACCQWGESANSAASSSPRNLPGEGEEGGGGAQVRPTLALHTQGRSQGSLGWRSSHPLGISLRAEALESE